MIKLKRITACIMMAAMLASFMPIWSSFAAETVPGWSLQLHNADAGAYIDQSQGVKGKASVKLVQRSSRTALGEYCRFYTSVSVKKGHDYSLEFNAKAVNANRVTVMFDWDESTRSSLTPISNNYDWTSFKIAYKSKKTGNVMIGFFCDDKTDALFLDNVKFYDKSQQNLNLVENGDFENCIGPIEPKNAVEATSDSKTDMFVAPAAINIDGKLDDWKDIEALPISRRQDLEQPTTAGDITVDIRFAYDEKNLYFAIVADDAKHFIVTDPNLYWQGDAVQFGISDPRDNSRAIIERGITYNPDDQSTFTTDEDFTAVATREGSQTVYEVSFAWNDFFIGGKQDYILFNALVANNDGAGRAYCMEITPGISTSKDAALFNRLAMKSKLNDLSYTIFCPTKVTANEKSMASICLFNDNDTAKSATISVEELGYKKTVEVAPNDSTVVDIDFIMEEESKQELKFRINDAGEEFILEKTIECPFQYETSYPTFRKKVEGYIVELKELLLKCEEKGISPDYEMASYSIICRYLEHADMMAANNYYDTMEEFDRVFTEEYEKTKEALNAYLNGERKPLTSPKYIAESGFEIDGTTVIAKTENNGVIEERPVFFVGYGHWDTAAKDLAFFSNAGLNTIQTEIRMSDVFVDGDSIDKWTLTIGGVSSAELTVSEEDSYTGGCSLKLIHPNASTHNVYKVIRQNVAVEPNTTYKYGLYAKAKGIQADNSVWFGVNGLAIEGRNSVLNSTDWRLYEYEYTTEADQTSLSFTILTENITESCFIDDCFVVKEGTNENLLDNNGFESVGESEKTKYDIEAEELGFSIDYSRIDWLREILKTAEQYNFMVDVGLAPHYMPKFILENDPEAKATRQNFTPYNISNAYVRKVISLWSRLIVSEIQEYASVGSVCLFNEPKVNPQLSDVYIPLWQNHIKSLYATIDELNEKYGSDYKSFEEVLMPHDFGSPLYEDYRIFNEWLMTDIHRFIAEEIRKENSDIPLHTKVMDYFNLKNRTHYFRHATDYEKMAEYMDLNGCDAFSYYAVTPTGVGGHGTHPLYSKMAWYDYQISVKNAPAWDTESHTSSDKKIVHFDDLVHYYTGADVWNGAVHGRGATQIWIYDLSNPTLPWINSEKLVNNNAVFRPADMVEVSRAALDLNRLSKEVTAIQKSEAKVGVLYSRASSQYVEEIMTSTIEAYRQAICSGQKVEFITETKPETIHKYDLVVIPEATNVPASVVENIKAYIENDGQVIITYDTALWKDGHNKAHDRAIIDYIYSNSIVSTDVAGIITDMKLSEVVLVDAATGEKLDNVEWSYAEYDGKIIVNILNYDRYNEVTAKIIYNGKTVTDFKELRSDKNLKDELKLKRYEPVLIQFEK